MSNLIKSNSIYVDQNKRVIDHDNSFKPITQFAKEVALYDESSRCNEWDDDAQKLFVDGLDVVSMQKLIDEEETLINEKGAKIIDEANEKAEQILNNARIEAEKIKELAAEEGKKIGYIQGFEEGSDNIKQVEAQLLEKDRTLQLEYEKQVKELEPMFVEILINLIKTISGVVLSERKEVLIYLIEKSLMNVGNSDSYILHVSKDDMDYVQEQRNAIEGVIASSATLQIMENNQLVKSQCLIETNGYYIDCSLEVEVGNLVKELQLITTFEREY